MDLTKSSDVGTTATPTNPTDSPIEPRADGYLERDGHRIYWLESGSADGPPLLILPSGPGAEHSPPARGVFDQSCRIVQIDPRGCGRSEPQGSVLRNTTDLLVE